VSLAGNLALMPVFVTLLHLPPLLANVLAVAACGVGNFGWGRVCFPGTTPGVVNPVSN
jgi:hypothetical protein